MYLLMHKVMQSRRKQHLWATACCVLKTKMLQACKRTQNLTVSLLQFRTICRQKESKTEETEAYTHTHIHIYSLLVGLVWGGGGVNSVEDSSNSFICENFSTDPNVQHHNDTTTTVTITIACAWAIIKYYEQDEAIREQQPKSTNIKITIVIRIVNLLCKNNTQSFRLHYSHQFMGFEMARKSKKVKMRSDWAFFRISSIVGQYTILDQKALGAPKRTRERC